MHNERIRDYFIEDILGDTWTREWRLITQAGYQEHGLVVEVTNESFTYEEANRLTELFQRNNVIPPLWEAQFDMAR